MVNWRLLVVGMACSGFPVGLFLRHALMDLQCSIVIATSGMMQSPAVKGGDKMYHRGWRKVGLFQRMQLLHGYALQKSINAYERERNTAGATIYSSVHRRRHRSQVPPPLLLPFQQ